MFLCMFMTTAHSLNYVIFNAKMTLFVLSLLWARGKVGVGLGEIMSSLH